IQTGHKLGMQLLDDNLFKFWKDRIVTKEEALFKANLPDMLEKKMQRWEAGDMSVDEEGGE
ncbi:MAG: type IV pili twitching motility protein PilT, partial [Planctomycetaceae bacterium]|nr:type IV pili twitching motility protein PilT [Planctomycetaceae bacterium]